MPSGTPSPAGFALYCYNYSTWRGHAGIHLEDLFRPAAPARTRHRQALLARVAAIAVEEGCPRLQWDVLEWNTPAIGFYQEMGAAMMTEWRTMRVTGKRSPDSRLAANTMTSRIKVIGGGLAGPEAALQAVRRGCNVTLYEMAPAPLYRGAPDRRLRRACLLQLAQVRK